MWCNYDEVITFFVDKLDFHLLEDTRLSETKRWVRIAPAPDADFFLLLAHAVKKQLVSKGVEESKLASNGYGSKRPIADNKTEVGKKQNRRVEMKIVGI